MKKLLPATVFALASASSLLRADSPSVFAEGDVSPFPDPNPVPSWTITNGLVIGQGSMGSLMIESGGTVSGDGMIFVGSGSGGEGHLTVTGAGSLLTNSSNLSIGYNGGVGTFTVADGGVAIFNGGSDIESGSATVIGVGSSWSMGGLHVSASEGLAIVNGGTVNSGWGDIYLDGVVTVSGMGSSWNVVSLNVNSTSGLTIADGANVFSGGSAAWDTSRIGFWDEGRVTVTGAGSTWTTTNEFRVGHEGGSGTLVIADGGTVANLSENWWDGINIGHGSNSHGQVTVSGAGSLWTNNGNLWFGGDGGTGVMIITNGGSVVDTNDAGAGYISEGSSVTVIGEGSKWTKAGGIQVDGTNGLVIADGGSVVINSFGSIYEGTATISGEGASWNVEHFYVSRGSVTFSDGGSGNVWHGLIEGGGLAVVTGAGSSLNATALSISSTNGLIVADGGSVFSGGAEESEKSLIGDLTEGRATVTGAGSTWTTTNEFRINRGELIIADGGTVANLSEHWWDGINIGHGSNSHGQVTVSGVGSLWTNNGSLGFGDDGGTGVMVVTNGGSVVDTNDFSDSYINEGSSVAVGGVGSTWTTAGSISVYGTNGLTVADGGSVTSSRGGIYNGSATVVGEEASWSADRLEVGGDGALVVEDGGSMTGNSVVIGNFPGNGSASVTGPGSSLAVLEEFRVGSGGGTGSLTIANGGSVSSTGGTYINYEAGDEGHVMVTGEGSSWTVNGMFRIGHDGGVGSLTIADGGVVSSFSENSWLAAHVGHGEGGMGSVIVAGPGSLWTNNGNLTFGYSDGVGTMLITNGGRVADDTYGISHIDNGSSVTVTGEGSSWRSAGFIMVNSTNGLTIANGGSISNPFGYIYDGSALVTGAGSSWTMTEEFVVGYGAVGSLTVADGGTVSSVRNNFIGRNSGYNPTEGHVTVEGSGSSWNMVGGFSIDKGSLTISNGGIVSLEPEFDGDTAYIGFGSSNFGHVTVTGLGSMWTNFGNLMIGGQGGTGTVEITDGGRVVDSNADGYSYISSQSLVMDISNRSSVTVTGEGSTWMSAGGISVGGTNGLVIADGGGVSSREGGIGDFNHISSALVTGAGSSWVVENDFYIGFLGSKTSLLTIGDEGVVTVGGTMSIHTNSAVVLDGGRFEVNDVEGISNMHFHSGVLVANGALSGNLAVPEGGTLGGAFVIAGNLNIAGVLSPGNSPDLVTVDGDLTLDLNSVTVMELAGYSRGADYDAINVFGDIAYGGALSIVFLDGFLPEVGDTFDLFLFDGEQSGLFGSIEFATPGASGVFHYESGVLEIMTVPEPATWALLIMGGALLAGCLVRRCRRLS